MLTLERLKEIIDKSFSPPFLEEGVVKARFIERTTEKTLQINIGRRDIWINEAGEITGAGTGELGRQ